MEALQGIRCYDPGFQGVRGQGRSGAGAFRRGKLISVVRVVREFGDELEADLLEFFGVDLLDLWRGRLSLRRVGVLIHSLARKPGRSSWLVSVDEPAAWSITDYLLARVSDAVELSNYLFLKANSVNSSSLDFPRPIPRPGARNPEEEAPEFAEGREVADWFSRMNEL